MDPAREQARQRLLECRGQKRQPGPRTGQTLVRCGQCHCTAGRAQGRLFFPNNPGGKEAWWKELLEEPRDSFSPKTSGGDSDPGRVKKFAADLPKNPNWWFFKTQDF